MTRAPVKMWAVWWPGYEILTETLMRREPAVLGKEAWVRILIVPPGYRVVKIRRKRK